MRKGWDNYDYLLSYARFVPGYDAQIRYMYQIRLVSDM